MAIQYQLGDMEKDVSTIEEFTKSVTELKNSLTKLTEELETHTWNSEGGQRMGQTIKDFINRELRNHIDFLEGKITDLKGVVATTEEMHRA